MTHDELHEYRLEQVEKAVATLGSAVEGLQDFERTFKLYAKVGAVSFGIVFGIIEPVLIAVLVKWVVS